MEKTVNQASTDPEVAVSNFMAAMIWIENENYRLSSVGESAEALADVMGSAKVGKQLHPQNGPNNQSFCANFGEQICLVSMSLILI